MEKRNWFRNENVGKINLKINVKKARPLNKHKMYAYFAPNGYVQVRSIADTKSLSKEKISLGELVTWKDYEKMGYFQKRIIVDIQIF